MRALLLSRDQAWANDLIGPEPLLLSEIVGTKFTKRSVQRDPQWGFDYMANTSNGFAFHKLPTAVLQ